MSLASIKSLAALFGLAAIAAATIMLGFEDDSNSQPVAGGSGDSATGTSYVSPTVPAMNLNPTNMSTGATVTAAAPATSLATSAASPTYKATAAAGCVNNGQCP